MGGGGVRRGWERQSWVKVEANQAEWEAAATNRSTEVQRLSWTVGRLEALRDFYTKLGREGIGTERTEVMAKDLVFQNVLRSLENEAKS